MYYISPVVVPSSIAKKMEVIQCNFLQCDSEEKRKYHLVAWDVIKRPLNDGGLDLRSILEMNKVLHGKQLWRFMNEREALWRRITKAKFGTIERRWFTRD